MTDHPHSKRRKREPARRRESYGAAAAYVRNTSFNVAWFFPALLAIAALSIAVAIAFVLRLEGAPLGAPLAARISWAVAAMLFSVFFVFTLVACHTVMFRCGCAEHAVPVSIATTIAGAAWTLLMLALRDSPYVGPDLMQDHLDNSAFLLEGVKPALALFNGFAVWAALVVIATSSVVIANEIDPRDDDSQEQLSRQFRGAKILTYCAAALLVTGVFEIAALHQWPAHGIDGLSDETRAAIEKTGAALSTGAGTIATLVLAAAYLPLIMVLRQRAYRVVRPWERTEAWLAMHGFALQPTQQLAKLLLILSPLLAGGPISYLITLLSEIG